MVSLTGGIFTFHLVCFCWIYFRAPSMDHATQMINQIVNHFTPGIFFEFTRGYLGVVAMMMVGYVLHFLPRSMDLAAEKWTTRLPLAGKAALMLVVILLCLQTKSASIQPFIYFQF